MSKGTIIFLAYHFPPSSSTVAGVRSGNLAYELAQNGWQVKVITPARKLLLQTDPVGQPVPCHPNLEIIETDHDLPELAHWWIKERSGILPKVLGKLGRGFFQLFDLDQSFGWIRHVKKAITQFEPGQISLILATGSPYISFQIAARIAQKLSCPYVLDYRDLWTKDPHNRVRNPLIKRGEKHLLDRAAAVTVVAKGMAAELAGLDRKVTIATISNGYDPNLFSQIKPLNFAEPAFVYTGRFMPPLSDAAPIMAALKKLHAQNPTASWKFHYYGQSGALVTAATPPELEDRVVNHGIVSRQEALAAIKGCQGSFVITSNSQTADIVERGILTGKIFEPIGLGCPIICITPEESEARNVVAATAAGRSFWSGESQAIAAYLAELLASPPPAGHGGVYSWPVLGKKYSDLLEEVIK